METDSESSSGLKWENISGNISSSSNFAGLSEPISGLQLGSQKDFGDNFISSSTNTSLASLPKRSRISPNTQNLPCCQVEGCNLDLSSAKDYHRRHRICDSHSKSSKVIIAGLERRFCQQCSRFHELSEFDDKKRSCRRRLSDHNARRRRQQLESILFTSPGLSSALYDRRAQNVISNRVPFSVSNSTREIAGSSLLRHARDSSFRPSNASGLTTTSQHYSSDEIPRSISSLQVDSNRFSSFHSLSPRIFYQCIRLPTTNSPIAQQFESARSLLSSNSWSLNESESTSMDSLVHGKYNPIWARFHSNNLPVEQVNSSVNLDNSQEFQLFKNNHYDSGCFSSHQRNL